MVIDGEFSEKDTQASDNSDEDRKPSRKHSKLSKDSQNDVKDFNVENSGEQKNVE